jgi:hypothetical protein
MDLIEQPVGNWRACGPPRPHKAGEARLMLITEDPGGAEVSAIPVAKRSPRVSVNVRGTCRMLQKDVSLYGTNRRSPLESTKVSKNEPKNGAKRTQKTTCKCGKEAKRSEKRTREGNILARFSPTLVRPRQAPTLFDFARAAG